MVNETKLYGSMLQISDTLPLRRTFKSLLNIAATHTHTNTPVCMYVCICDGPLSCSLFDFRHCTITQA